MVNFLICGTQKGGTTALYYYLKSHPKICVSLKKEVHFFDEEANFATKEVDYASYHAHFSLQTNEIAIGEATPIYMYWQDCTLRIWKYNPQMKLILILRNPIERAFSHWNMERSRNADHLSFWNALQHEEIRCRAALPLQHRVYSYIDRGFYSEQLRRIWRFFPKSQVLVIKHEDLRNQHQQTLSRVCEFLEINEFNFGEPKTIHARQYDVEMSKRERNYLKQVFRFEIKQLERMLDWDLQAWLEN